VALVLGAPLGIEEISVVGDLTGVSMQGILRLCCYLLSVKETSTSAIVSSPSWTVVVVYPSLQLLGLGAQQIVRSGTDTKSTI